MTPTSRIPSTPSIIRSLDLEATAASDAPMEAAAPSSTPETATLSSMPSVIPTGGLHPVVHAATASSVATAAGDAAAQGAAEGTRTGGRQHMQDMTFTKTSDTSSNKL